MPHIASPSRHAFDDDEGLQDFLDAQDPVDVRAAHWLVRRQEGLTAAEQLEYDSWLAEDEKHAQAVAELEGVLGDVDALPDDEVQALKAGLPPAEAEIQTTAAVPEQAMRPSLPTQGQQGKQGMPRMSWLESLVLLIPRMAISLFLVSLLGAGWLGWNSWQTRPSFVQAYQTERGQQRHIDLPDGSQLWLDAGSRAEVALYRQRRQVVLTQGQAMFTVQANVDRPFDVLAGPLRVTVVGTEFAVRNDVVTAADGQASGGISVAVEQGRVRVTRREAQGGAMADTQSGTDQGSAPLVLSPGEAIRSDAAGQITSRSTAVADVAPWRQGRVVFEGVTLAQALAEFERYGDTQLVIHDPKVAALKVHGSYSLQGLQAFIDALPQVLPVRLVRKPGQKTEITLRP